MAGSRGYVVDYDRTDIPASYDRGHDHGAAVLDQWMRAIASHVETASVHRILDLACGTGRFAPSLSAHFDADVFGLDPSLKMLQQAQHKRNTRVGLAAGYAEALPLRSQSIDLIFISMAFHHFEAPAVVARECARVLRPTGRVVVRTISADRISDYPYLPFFPGTTALLERRLPSRSAMRAAFEAAALRTVAADVVIQEIARDYAEYADKLSAGADTTLNSLSREQFNAGLAAMRAKRTDTAITEPIDVLVFAASDIAA